MTTILVIEDDTDTRRVIAGTLKDQYDLIETDNSEEALQFARRNLPDVILCDITLPEMDGFGLLQALREDEATQSISFIFLTGTHDQATIRRAMNMGADDYLSKPFHPTDLREAVKARLSKKALREAQLRKRLEDLRRNITLSLPHELRTAIMVIEGYAYLMMQDKNSIEPQQYEMLQSISDYAARLHVMSEKFLWYCKTQILLKDDSANHIMPLSMDALGSAVAVEKAMYLERIDDLDLQIGAGMVHAPEEYIQKIIEEVVENAFKFSTSGKRVSIRGKVSGECYTLTVTDKGRGMTDEQIRGIGGFMQFDRLAQEQQGTGLGLIIARRLTELCDGTLHIQSELGCGNGHHPSVSPSHPEHIKQVMSKGFKGLSEMKILNLSFTVPTPKSPPP